MQRNGTSKIVAFNKRKEEKCWSNGSGNCCIEKTKKQDYFSNCSSESCIEKKKEVKCWKCLRVFSLKWHLQFDPFEMVDAFL